MGRERKFHDVDVSIILLTWRHHSTLSACLDSIDGQSFDGDLELIVVANECSASQKRDLEIRLGKSPRRSLVCFAENVGVNPALNAGAELARGKYLVFFSGDDLMLEHRISTQFASFEKDQSNAAILVSNVQKIDPSGIPLFSRSEHRQRKPLGNTWIRLLKGNWIPAAGVMVRHQAFLDAGGFDNRLSFEDYDLWLKLAKNQEVLFLPTVVSKYRLAGMGAKAQTYEQLRSTQRILLKWFGQSIVADLVILRHFVALIGRYPLSIEGKTWAREVEVWLRLFAPSLRDQRPRLFRITRHITMSLAFINHIAKVLFDETLRLVRVFLLTINARR